MHADCQIKEVMVITRMPKNPVPSHLQHLRITDAIAECDSSSLQACFVKAFDLALSIWQDMQAIGCQTGKT
jgi:DNA-binding FadR family transcriptional regulator